MFGGYVYETQQAVDDYESTARADREAGRRAGRRLLVAATMAVILKRARDRRA